MSTPAVSTLLSSLRTRQATSPALIWYGDAGERIELSGKVLDNWVAKTSNFLVDELDAEPGMRVQLDLPVHWKSLVWVLAAWQTGCTVILADDAPADVTVTASGGAEGAGVKASGTVVAVALGALDLSFPGELAPGVVDYAAEIRSYADTYLPGDEPDGDAPALEVRIPTSSSELASTVRYAELPLTADAGAAADVLLASSADLPLVLAAALRVWAAGGAVVLTPAGTEPDERLLTSERVTKRLGA